ncbi:1-phosphofructokinase [Lederbergia lenta]|uniref:Tagatose-6-phosphate kinase n=1 Tax=Lederbergia lenta TaxID=1467 RepID=A0A2X4WER0_LEDLE|nr:1-phosphofructokinase [Lederbergia lenta]MEC2322724.1 1-phosphofructokinase [Lederbergia lenta]SQI61671.1 putative 1-phosphofructokinase [Lederbergia lenta]
MIYTLTLNPSIDYVVELDQLQLGELNRIRKETKFPGGKGINVSRILKRVGIENKALGFIGGYTGQYVEAYLKDENIQTDFTKIEEETRINIKLNTEMETELNAAGPKITLEEYEMLKQRIQGLRSGDFLILSGSIPATLPNTTYEELVQICRERKVEFLADAEGELLRKVLPYKPFLVKPNHHELGDLFNTVIRNAEEAIPYGRKLIDMGAKNVIVSLAGEGAILINKEEVFSANVPFGDVKSSVGAGDSLVAGFIAQFTKTANLEEAFQYGVASGSATAFSLGLCTEAKIEALLPQVIVKQRGENR